uniref:Uncharacterized protein n=1 Tax=Arundo donax TaxID=35708 RepID=A0A0A9CL75_ARUDO
MDIHTRDRALFSSSMSWRREVEEDNNTCEFHQARVMWQSYMPSDQIAS